MPNAMNLSPTPKPPMSAAKKGGAAATIALILASTYAVEGGYVNDKDDHGGETIYGITVESARADGYTGDMRQFPKHCYGNVTVCADKIYVKRYIEDPGYTPLLTLEPAVARELVDTAVNAGPARSSIFFQSAINVLCKTSLKVDGRVGPATISAYQVCKSYMAANGGKRVGDAFCVTMLNSLDGAQEKFYRRLAARPGQAKFLRGWLRLRIGNVPRSACVL